MTYIYIYMYIYISFIRSHVTYNSGTIWKRWQTNTKCGGKRNRLSEKSTISTRTWKSHQDIAIYIKKISRYLKYGSNDGGAATPQPSLTVFDSKTGQRDSRTSKTPPTSHIKKCLYDQEIPQRHSYWIHIYAIQSTTDTKQFMNLSDPGINFCIMSVKSWITAQVTMNIQISPVSPKSTIGIGRRPPSYILDGWISAAHHCI